VEDPQVTEKHTWPERLPYTTQQVLSPSTCITTAEWSKRGGGDTSEPSATDCHVSVTRSSDHRSLNEYADRSPPNTHSLPARHPATSQHHPASS